MKIVFLGNMNNMPYYFAKEFKKRGFDITFIVDAEKDYLLDRPESWDIEIGSQYPDWIIEKTLKWDFKAFKFAFPKLYFRDIISYLNSFDVIFLNGHWISLGGFIKKNKIVIDLFAGTDLDAAGDFTQVNFFSKIFKQSDNFFKKNIPSSLINIIYRRMIAFQRKGIRRADAVNYYPTGVNPRSDKLLSEIKTGQQYQRLELRGFDCHKFPYREPLSNKEKFSILNVTRFCYLNNRNENKRNDIMIRGIGLFLKKHQLTPADVEIFFFEKGEDLEDAKLLCDTEGLTPFINWQKQVSVEELNNFHEKCDVAFDQLGVQWVGAGLFSMLSGRPLIANGRPDVFEPLLKENLLFVRLLLRRRLQCGFRNYIQTERWLKKLDWSLTIMYTGTTMLIIQLIFSLSVSLNFQREKIKKQY